MRSYVYAISDCPDEPLPRQLGLNDEVLDEVVFGDIAAVISRHGGAHVAADAASLWRHEQVLEALMETRAVVPVRFGVLASRRELEEKLRQRYCAFVEDTARLRDHVEIGVRFLATLKAEATRPRVHASGSPTLGQTPQADAPGTAYLQARLAREQRRRDESQDTLDRVRATCGLLGEHASASRVDAGGGDASVLSAAFLVHRDGLAAFRQQLVRLAQADPELALLCTGPWPAYSFVSAHSKQPAAEGARSHVH